MKNVSGTCAAGFIGMIGGLLFSFYFVGLNPLLELFNSQFETETVSAIKMIISCVASLCLAVSLIGLLTSGIIGGWRNGLGVSGTFISLLGLTSYVVGSIYIYSFPEKALRQFFTPGGSTLIMIGMLLLATAMLKAGRYRGWHAVTPLLVGLYFPLQFPLQALFFLSKNRGPSPLLLSVWGIFWILLGYAVWSNARRTTGAPLVAQA
jgi:hypothetical protein